jgi:hypothetical protein
MAGLAAISGHITVPFAFARPVLVQLSKLLPELPKKQSHLENKAALTIACHKNKLLTIALGHGQPAAGYRTLTNYF